MVPESSRQVQIEKLSGYVLRTVMRLPRPRDEVFAFFADARNLELLTPDSLHFHILTPDPIVMAEGTLIDYRLRIRGVPVRWRTEISVWDPPHCFVDRQRLGPYRWWIHRHDFHEEDGHTVVSDEVKYGFLGGRLVHRLFVGPELRHIFEYRCRQLDRQFNRSLPGLARQEGKNDEVAELPGSGSAGAVAR